MENNVKLNDLFLNYNYDEELSDGTSVVGYYLKTKEGCSTFLIVFDNIQESILCTIDVDFYYESEFECHFESTTKFEQKEKEEHYIYFSINGTEGDVIIDFKQEEVVRIIPLNELIDYEKVSRNKRRGVTPSSDGKQS